MKIIFKVILTLWLCYASNLAFSQATQMPQKAKSDTLKLKEVVISAQRKFIQQKTDRTVINVSALISTAGTSVLEILTLAPGVSVDQNGTITMKGKQGVMVLIDDKLSYLSGADLEAYLRSLSSDIVQEIELMTNPPAKYDASGNAGVINIKTKKQQVKGFNIGVNLSLRQTKVAATNNSMDMNFRKGKVNVFGNFAYTIRNGYADVNIYRQYKDEVGNPLNSFNQDTHFQRRGYGFLATAGADYFASEHTTFGIAVKGLSRYPENLSTSIGHISNSAGAVISTITSENHEKGNFKNGGLNLNYRRTFDNKGAELSGSLDYLNYTTLNNQNFSAQSYDIAPLSLVHDSLFGHLPSGINIYAGKMDFSQTLATGWKLESGIKSSYTNSDNLAEYFNVVAQAEIPDYEKTNHFKYQESINAGYLNLNKDFKRLNIQAGLRIEQTSAKGHQFGNIQRPDSAFQRNYLNLFPTFYALYKIDSTAMHQVKFNYGRRIDRPYYQDLNPFISPLDKFTYYVGNPYLKPSFSDNFELSYIFKNRLTMSTHYSSSHDAVNETIEIANGNYYSRPGNIGNVQVYGISVDGNYAPTRWLSLQLNGELSNIKSKSDFYTGTLNTSGYFTYLQALIQLSAGKGWSGQLDGNYQSRQTNAQFLTAAKGRLNAALAKKISASLQLKISVSDILYTNINKGTINNLKNTEATYKNLGDTRVGILSVSMRFGKAVKGQRRHDAGSADTEQGRVKN
ncbi:outer membrane beta-barrel family protein [Pedobacter duraquae]|nr:outer membrane beta-barrel family protein [Pedobacter duraquae]